MAHRALSLDARKERDGARAAPAYGRTRKLRRGRSFPRFSLSPALFLQNEITGLCSGGVFARERGMAQPFQDGAVLEDTGNKRSVMENTVRERIVAHRRRLIG